MKPCLFYERAGEELADVQVSCETLLYIIGYQSESERAAGAVELGGGRK